MPVIFHNAANDTRFRIYLTSNLLLYDVYRLLTELRIIISPPKHFMWKMFSNKSELDYSLTLYENHICADSKIEISCVNAEEINVKIVKGFGGADCDIDVPMDATVGDVIVGLINEGFLDADTASATTVLYNKDADGGISSGVKYDDRSKTVKEYGWHKGQTLIAVCSTCDGGAVCMTSVVLPDMQAINYVGYPDSYAYGIFSNIRKEFNMQAHYYQNSRCFYYLYDNQRNRMFLEYSELHFSIEMYEATTLQGYNDVVYKLKNDLYLKRQIVEEIIE